MEYPQELTSRLNAGDEIVLFIQFTSKGAGGLRKKHPGWVALTKERIIYNATLVSEGGRITVETANFPLSKVSSMTTRQVTIGGCLSKQNIGVLELNVQGGKYAIAVGKDVNVAKPMVAAFTARTE
jgi:hypothetical protein